MNETQLWCFYCDDFIVPFYADHEEEIYAYILEHMNDTDHDMRMIRDTLVYPLTMTTYGDVPTVDDIKAIFDTSYLNTDEWVEFGLVKVNPPINVAPK